MNMCSLSTRSNTAKRNCTQGAPTHSGRMTQVVSSVIMLIVGLVVLSFVLSFVLLVDLVMPLSSIF